MINLVPIKKYKPFQKGWKHELYQIIFRSTTKKGKIFDVTLLVIILLSILTVMLDSIGYINIRYGTLLYVLEWIFTLLFAIEYILRIVILKNPWKYILSPIGIIDLLSILPTFIGIFVVGSKYLIVIRSLRLLRVFRIFKLSRYLEAGAIITKALQTSYRKILMFMMFIALLTIIIGSIMYIVEEHTPGFESIPNSIYWAAVTLTTVGYGDISPETPLGKFLSVIVMLSGYSIIAVPTGIITAEMANLLKRNAKGKGECPRCGVKNHAPDARYCRICAEPLDGKNGGQ